MKKKSKLQPPKYIWADCDPEAPRDVRWAFYRSLADQRGNRPDLKAIKLRIVPNGRADLPRIDDVARESGCEGNNRG